MWVESVKEEVAELGGSQEEGVFSFGRANIKGKLGKRLTQNLESHQSSDFSFTMRGGGKGDWGDWGKYGSMGAGRDRLGQTGTEQEQEQQQERVQARVSRAHAGAGAGAGAGRVGGEDLTDDHQDQKTDD